jgi:hypothetical protein
MHPATTQPGDIQATVVFVLFIVGLCVAYWRAALKMLAIILISLAVLSVILAVLGMIDTLHGLHNLMG